MIGGFSMSLQVKVKLKLSRQNKKIIVKYNTFEKATFDQYLLTSLAIHAPSNEDAMQYIDEITSNGSLNSHFKKMYSDIVELSPEQRKNIVQSSNFPVLKIDESNRYEYYPELDISVYKGKIYTEDIEALEREKILQLIYMQEDVIDLHVVSTSISDKAEPYEVKIENSGQIAIRMKGKDIEIDPELFQDLLVVELNSLDKYKGTIHTAVNGDRWSLLTNATVNNLYSNDCYFYDDTGNHLQIRNANIRQTEIANISGLYIYRESFIEYEKDEKLSLKVLEVVQDKNIFNRFNPNFYLTLFKNLPNKNVIAFINIYYADNNLPRDVAMYILELLRKGILSGWNTTLLQNTLKYAKQDEYQLIYQANNAVKFDIMQLLYLDKRILTEQDKQQVDAYNRDLEAKKESVKNIIGNITTKGLRERAKVLKADADNVTKKFSKLCNQYIGHTSKDLQNANLEETEKILKDVQELRQLSLEIERRLSELNSTKV